MPNLGDHHTLLHEGEGRALVRTRDGVELLSNVCRHRQAVMLRGRGNVQHSGSGNIVCPLHRWTYDLHGQLVGAPHFAADPCLHLRNYPLQRWNGLLFEAGGPDVATALTQLDQLAARTQLDFSGYVLDKVHLHECDYNWKTFIEVYLEDYHVGPFHRALASSSAATTWRWEFGARHSVQTVGLHRGLAQAGSPVYARWRDAVLRFGNGQLPPQGAIWLTLYPGVMVEWYPHVLVVSTLHPLGPQKTLNMVEFYYPEEIAAVRARFRRGRAGRLHGNLHRG